MAVRIYKPTSPGRRNSSVQDFSDVTRRRPERSLTVRIKKHSGHNNQGFITTRHRGGGARRLYRIIDFVRNKDDIPARVKEIEYDPNRNCRIALLSYLDGEKRYIIAPDGLKVGDEVLSGEKVEPKTGNAMPLASIPVGLSVHNIELTPGGGGKLVRGAGTVATLTAREGKWAHISLPSGEVRRVHVRCRATIGAVGNAQWNRIRWGKAGRTRHRGIRPTVRGVAMNPVAHPMGGGEGRSGGGRPPCSKTGKLSKGGKTRRRRNPTNARIIRRRTSKRHGQLKVG
ncbi:MAG: 50S ribosomal protein L2 [Phycisphaerae bacterium]|nr:50S ribosomal protein L2 [Phycisphaerae bacterium]